jgi:hypothetical protein
MMMMTMMMAPNLGSVEDNLFLSLIV